MATLNVLEPMHTFPATAPAASSIRTLVVDDTPGMLELIAFTFRANPGIEVVGTAANGLAAISMAMKEMPKLVIMDINMPKMSGFEAAIRIKRRMPETKIIMMSADENPELALAAMDCGADGFIPKNRLFADYAWHIEQLFMPRKTRRKCARRQARP